LTPFEFYLAFYGLLLGLSVAELASGFLNAIGARHNITFGWLTPLLAIFIFLDITSFWIYAWGIRESVSVNWGTMFGALVVALIYYLAAGLVFPRRIEEWPNLNEHYHRNKRYITGGILAANVITTSVTIWLHPPAMTIMYWFGVLTYWPMLLLLPISKHDKLDIALLLIMIGGYVANVFLPSSWILN
jgi:hypothetical protein